MQSRDELRSRMRRARRALDPHLRVSYAEQLARRMVDNPLFQRSRRIALYIPVKGEMDPSPLLRRALTMSKRVYLPVLVPYRHNRLWFAPYWEGCQLLPNRFGIPEPKVSKRSLLNPTALDLAFVPLVAFDADCNRLGMGGGYYDRTFSFLRHRIHWKKPHLVGIAYDFQKVDRLKTEAWDVPLSGVATESQFYAPKRLGRAKR
jgi:5-formyltetrahydrofolate cyclo-ligase